jgi:hypothetical protein
VGWCCRFGLLAIAREGSYLISKIIRCYRQSSMKLFVRPYCERDAAPGRVELLRMIRTQRSSIVVNPRCVVLPSVPAFSFTADRLKIRNDFVLGRECWQTRQLKRKGRQKKLSLCIRERSTDTSKVLHSTGTWSVSEQSLNGRHWKQDRRIILLFGSNRDRTILSLAQSPRWYKFCRSPASP